MCHSAWSSARNLLRLTSSQHNTTNNSGNNNNIIIITRNIKPDIIDNKSSPLSRIIRTEGKEPQSQQHAHEV